jgi:hypothetical protein
MSREKQPGDLVGLYVSPELMAFAKRADVSPVHLAAALRAVDFKQLDAAEILKLSASCTAPPPRKPDLARDLARLLGSV